MRTKFENQWMVTRTVQSTRRNLFDMTPRREHQIATLISGSSTRLKRFDQSLALIQVAPQMHSRLCKALAVLDHYGFVQSPIVQELRRDIANLLVEIDRSLDR